MVWDVKLRCALFLVMVVFSYWLFIMEGIWPMEGWGGIPIESKDLKKVFFGAAIIVAFSVAFFLL